MTVHLWDHKLSYLSVPKCACSSAKMFLHHIKTGEPFSRASTSKSIHQLYPTIPFADQPIASIQDHLKLAVVRGPIARLLSAHANKIVKDRCLYRPIARARCLMHRLPLDPSFDVFVDRLDEYQRVSRVIQTHTQPLTHHLGDDPAWFDHLISIPNLGAFQTIVSDHTGTNVRLGHMNKAKQRAATPDLDPDFRRSLRKMFESDFDIFGRFFLKPAAKNPLGRTGAEAQGNRA